MPQPTLHLRKNLLTSSKSAQEKGAPPSPAKPRIHKPHEPQQVRLKGPPPHLPPPPLQGHRAPTPLARQAPQSHTAEAGEASAELTPKLHSAKPRCRQQLPQGSEQGDPHARSAPRGIAISVLRDASQVTEGYQSERRGIALSRPRQSRYLPRRLRKPRVSSATGSMLSGIYYIHEDSTQRKEPPPNPTRTKPPVPAQAYPSPLPHRPNTAPKRLHGGNKVQSKG